MLKTKNLRLVSIVFEYNSKYCNKDYADIYRNNKSIVGFHIYIYNYNALPVLYIFDSSIPYVYFSCQHFSGFTGSFYTLYTMETLTGK